MSSHQPTTAYLAFPIRVPPLEAPPETIVYVAIQRLTFQPSHPDRLARVNAILNRITGVNLEDYDDEPPDCPYPTTGHPFIEEIQPTVQELLAAGIQPHELALVLNSFYDAPVKVLH